MLIDIMAVLEAKLPEVFCPTALTYGPLAGRTSTMMLELRGTFTQFTIIETGFDCWLEIRESGVTTEPVGFEDTDWPATLLMTNRGCWFVGKKIIPVNPRVVVPNVDPVNVSDRASRRILPSPALSA